MPRESSGTRSSTWALGFGPRRLPRVSKGGGYDPLVHDQVGIGVWWVPAGRRPGRRPAGRRLQPARLGWRWGCSPPSSLWTALSLIWTESSERTAADLARLLAISGSSPWLLFAAGAGAARSSGAVGAGGGVVAVVALLSRLHPAWFPDADQTAGSSPPARTALLPAQLLERARRADRDRLPAPPRRGHDRQAVALRALAAAALPMMALTIFFTLSRGGIAAAVSRSASSSPSPPTACRSC